MKLSKSTMVWRSAVCIAAVCLAACSEGAGTANEGDSTATAGAGGSAGASVLPPSAVAPVAGSGGTAGGTVAAGATAGTSGAGTAGMAVAAAGSSAAGAAAGGSGGSGGSAATPDPGVACDPADKTADPTPASFKQIMGYQGLSTEPTTGPSKPVLESDPGLPDWTVYRPETLDGAELHPVLAWGNGGCLKNGTLYGNWLLELASWGYIVLADGPPTEAGSDPLGAGMRAGAGPEVLMSAIEWLIAENDRPCSQYYRKVAVTKLAVAGQSCGGLMALASAGDERITTAIIGNSGLFAPDQGIYSALHTPIAYLIGGESDLAYANAEQDYENIDGVPILNANMSTGHGGTWNAPNGGEFGRVGLMWLNWLLKDDMTAKANFVGADCGLCKPPSMWTVKKKMLD